MMHIKLYKYTYYNMAKSTKLSDIVIENIKNNNNNTKKYKEDDMIDIVVCISEDIHEKTKYKICSQNIIKSISRNIHYSKDKDVYYFDVTNKNSDFKDFYKILKENIIDAEVDELEELESKLSKDISGSTYKYPTEKEYNLIKRLDKEYGPYGTQWIHDVQIDDKYDRIIKRREQQYYILRDIELPEQRSPEWFKMRSTRITASDIGTVLGDNKYEPEYKFILKKTIGSTFTSNKFCYHGKKLEEIATLIYQYRMNVKVEEFGLMEHPKYNFLGASPDGICSPYKLDGKHKTEFVGRMLEIKCPLSRDINKIGPIKGYICPIYYWDQVQIQLECCDLDECDFLQCKLREYTDRDEFINDTDELEPFRSKKYKYEKGCLIQLLPKDKISEPYWQTVWDSASFIYPDKIEMTPYECDIWIAKQMQEIATNSKYYKYVFDKVIYWRLEDLSNVTINRDREWFKDSFPKLKKMWDRVLFFRNNPDKLDIFTRYINTRPKKMNKDIMKVADTIINTKSKVYDKNIKNILNKIKKEEDKLQEKKEKLSQSDRYINSGYDDREKYSEFEEYAFSDDEN